MERFEAINNHYEVINEDARISQGHGRVEFLTTIRYIEKYLKKGMSILEIGAGTGIYSHYFARMGYKVDAVELVEKNIEIFQSKTLPYENVSIVQGDAVNLSNIPSGNYDIVLLLGPMYHLFEKTDQRKAISEALRVTKADGVVFCAYVLADFTILRHAFQRGKFKDLVKKGMLDPVTFQTYSGPKDIFQNYVKSDIDELMSHFNVQRLHFVGTDLFTHYFGHEIDAMDEEMFEIYLSYHYTVCEREDLVGASAHVLDIFRKGCKEA